MPAPTERFRRLAHRPLILGHRGARREAPENTLLAFDRARRSGADGVELDVQASADGVPVVLHDFDLRRLTSGRDERTVGSLDAAELARVDLGEGQSPPRLEQVLDWAEKHSMLVNVELKTRDARRDPLATSVAALLAERPQLEGQVLVSSFHPRLLSRFKRELPAVPIGWLFTRAHPCWARLAGPHAAEAVHPEAGCFEAQASLPRPSSMLVNAWTVNDVALARKLNDRGVDVLITDVPGEIMMALAPSLLENPLLDGSEAPSEAHEAE